MQAIVIEVNQADAYVSLGDGTNINIGITKLPPNIKSGEKINIHPGTTKMINHNISTLL